MRRSAITLAAVVPLLLLAIGPVAADTSLSPAGTHMETGVTNLDCTTDCSVEEPWVLRETYAIEYENGDHRVCAGRFTHVDNNIGGETSEFGCNDTPAAFTFSNKGFIVGWGTTSVQLYNRLTGAATDVVSVSASLAPSGSLIRSSQSRTETDGTCTYKISERFVSASLVVGTFTFDATSYAAENAGYANYMTWQTRSVVPKCPH
jgi:hypothetical protein